MKGINLDNPMISFAIFAISLLVIFPVSYFLDKEGFLTGGRWKVTLVMYIVMVIFMFIRMYVYEK